MNRTIAFLFALALAAFTPLAQAATTGVVMDRDGKPLGGVRVAAYAHETVEQSRTRYGSAEVMRKPLAETTTDAKGTFSLDGVKASTFAVQFSAAGFAPAAVDSERNEDLGAIGLRPAAERRGSVTAGGKPVAGATVIVAGMLSEVVVKTDEAGKYSVPDPKSWATRITVLHPEYAVSDESATIDRNWRSIDRTLSRGADVTGRVVGTDGKTPAAGVTLFADGFPVATSGEDGSFTASRMPANWKALTAKTATAVGAFSKGTRGETLIRLVPGGTLSGVVRDSKTQQPVAGARVDLSQPRLGMITINSRSLAITDEKGVFVIVTTPGNYGVTIEHPSYRTRAGNDVALIGAKRLDRTFSVTPLVRVSGTVLFEDKTPVAGGSVNVRPVTTERFRMPGILLGLEAATGPDGRFSVKGTHEEEFEVIARKRGFPEGTSARMRLEPGEKKGGVNIVVARGLEVTGTVLDERGRPVAGVSVASQEAEGGSPGMMIVRRRIADLSGDDNTVETDANGKFVVRLKEATFDLSFKREGFAPSWVRGVKVARDLAPLEVTMKAGVEISGRVTRGGNGIEGVNILAISQPTGDFSATTDALGYFTIRDLAPGQFMLLANKPDDAIRENRTVTAPSRDIQIEIPPGGRIEGRVVDKQTGAAITAFRAGVDTSRRGGGMMIMAPPSQKDVTSADGTFVLENVPAGTVEVVVQAPGYVTGRVPGVTVEEGKTANAVEVKLDTGSRITGRVSTTSGSAVADARIVISTGQRGPGGFGLPGEARLSATTDSSGQYTIEGVENGSFELVVTHAKYVQTRKSIEVNEKEVRVDVRIDAGMKVTGQVVTEAGAPVTDANVSASTAASSAGSSGARTDANGNFVIEALPAARYTFYAQKQGLSTATLRDVDIATSGPIRLVMTAGAVIYGRISGLTESDLAAAEVMATSSTGRASVAPDPAGNFRIEGAPTGSVQVSASTGGFGSRKSSGAKTVQVEAGGSAQVDLEFRSDVAVTGRVSRNGLAVKNARVIFVPEGRRGTDAMSVTDESGYYSITGLEDGPYNVSVVDQNLGAHSKKYEVRGSGRFDIEFPVTALRGRVVDAATGTPLAGARIEIRSADSGPSVTFGMMATSDSSGSFTMSGLEEGPYRVSASLAGYGTASADATVTTSGGDVELKLSKSDGVRVRIIDGRDGRALNGRIAFSDMMDRPVTEESVNSGDEGDRVAVAPGQYLARVSANGYAPVTVTISSPGQVTVPLTPGGTLEIASKSSVVREGRLVDGAGRSYMLGGRARSFGIDPAPAVSTYRLIAAGTYTLQIVEKGQPVSSKQVTILEGRATRVDIE